MSKKKTRAGAQDWTDVVDEAPRADLPDEKAYRGVRRKRRYVALASYALIPALLMNGVLLTNISNSGDEPAGDIAGVSDAGTATARAVAVQAVTDWLDSSPSPLPGGQVVSWNYAELVPQVADPEDPDAVLHAHDVTVGSGELLFTAQVSVLSHPAHGIKVASEPSLVPSPPATDEQFSGPPWPGAPSVSASTSIEQAVRAWAGAFGGGDPDELRLAVGDPDAEHSYLPLVGADVERTTIDHISVQPELITSDGVPDEPEQVIARVRLDLTWPVEDDEDSADADTGSGDDVPTAAVDYDLLIDRASTASPQVVAWGGPGSGPELAPYSNAVTGRDLVVTAPQQVTDETQGEDE